MVILATNWRKLLRHSALCTRNVKQVQFGLSVLIMACVERLRLLGDLQLVTLCPKYKAKPSSLLNRSLSTPKWYGERTDVMCRGEKSLPFYQVELGRWTCHHHRTSGKLFWSPRENKNTQHLHTGPCTQKNTHTIFTHRALHSEEHTHHIYTQDLTLRSLPDPD